MEGCDFSKKKNLLDDISKENENIYSFPLDVTNQKACLDVFENIKSELQSIDIAVFCTGMHDPKSEKNFNLDKVRDNGSQLFWNSKFCQLSL